MAGGDAARKGNRVPANGAAVGVMSAAVIFSCKRRTETHAHAHTHALCYDQNRSAKEKDNSRTAALEHRGCSQQPAVHEQNVVKLSAANTKDMFNRSTMHLSAVQEEAE